MDARTPRDGKTIEELGTYDPMVRETDKRVTVNAARVDYWLSVGALPTDAVKILLDKYKGKVPEKRVDAKRVPTIPERLMAAPVRTDARAEGRRARNAAAAAANAAPPPPAPAAAPEPAPEPAPEQVAPPAADATENPTTSEGEAN